MEKSIENPTNVAHKKNPYKIAPTIDAIAKKVREEQDPKQRLESLLFLVCTTAIEIDKVYAEQAKRDDRIVELTEEVRRLRGKVENESD